MSLAAWLTCFLLHMAWAVCSRGESCPDAASKPLERTRRTKDGRTFIFDAFTNAWRLKEEPREKEGEAVQLALPWSQFNVSFQGDFKIAGHSILLGEEPERRSQENQQHADTGTSIWDGAVALAKVLERNPWLVKDREVLELGAGRGLAGLAAAALGARRVVLTDLAYCLEGLKAASKLTSEGSLPGAVEVAELDWARAGDFLAERPFERLDVLLAADVVWLLELADLLAGAVRTVSDRYPDITVLIVHQTRSANVETAFLEAMASRSLQLAWALPGGTASTSEGVAWHEDFTPDARIKLWCFRPLPYA